MLALILKDVQGTETIQSDHLEGSFVQVQVEGLNHDCQSAYDGWTAGPYRLAAYADRTEVPEGKQVASSLKSIVDGVPTITDTFEDIPPPALSDYQSAIQSLIDGTAQERNYDSGNSCVSYVGDPNATYDGEATAFRDWRSSVWTYAYGELAKVQAGTRAQPTVEAFLAELPALTWP